MYFVYFLQSEKDKSIYVGFTNDLVKRINQHNLGKTRSIKSKLPLRLIYYEAYIGKTIARKREIQIKKSWHEKELIINRLKNK